MEDNILTVKIDNQDINIEVLDIIENEENNKEYIIYSPEGTEDVYMSILEETEDTYNLKTIEDEKEVKMLEDFLKTMVEENGDE